jgi:hypothetical protein
MDMQALADNWFFVVLILLCIGMHTFGHGQAGHHGSRGKAADDEKGTNRKEAAD